MNLFAYGTLMWPAILEAVMGRRLAGAPAALAGYQRLRVKGASYPVVVRAADSAVEGVLYCGLTAAEFQRLDAFEGPEYDRAEIEVAGTKALVYVLGDAHRHIAEAAEWTPEQMRPEDLAAFCPGDPGGYGP